MNSDYKEKIDRKMQQRSNTVYKSPSLSRPINILYGNDELSKRMKFRATSNYFTEDDEC